jgi:hypothetical protein
MFQQSEQIDQIAAALADMQSHMEGIFKESKNPVFGSRYAELSKVWNAFQRVGPSHGLSVVQIPGHFDAHARTMTLSVRLLHSSGQWLGGEMSMPLSRADAHAYGSACTYARRYSLAALVGICPHDDDGNDASGVGTGSVAHRSPSQFQKIEQSGRQPRSIVRSFPEDGDQAERSGVKKGRGACPSGAVATASPELVERLKSLIDQSGANIASICGHFGAQNLENLSQEDAERAERLLRKKLNVSLQGAN